MYLDLKKLFSETEQEQLFSFNISFGSETAPNGSIFLEPVKAEITAMKESASALALRLKATASCKGECARCLETVEYLCEVNKMFHITQEDMQDVDSELPIIDSTLNVDELVWQEMLLSMPMILHCTADCEGLCPVCGHPKKLGCNCNISSGDERLQILKELLQ